MKRRNLLILGLSVLGAVFTFGNAFATDKPIDIYTIQPWYEEESWSGGDEHIPLPEGVDNQADIIPAAARIVTSNFPNYHYSLVSKNEPVTAETIKKIGPNQIVLWQGHGNWDEKNHSMLRTGNNFDGEKLEDPTYEDDFDNGRIVLIEEGGGGLSTNFEGITSKYIDKYGGDMSGSLIYIGACESGVDGVLAQAFLDKGAATVVVMTKTIQTLYGNIMQYTTVKLLTEINPETGDYYTLGEALAKAKSIYGKDDLEKGFYPAALGAEPVIYGDANYHIASVEKPLSPNSGLPEISSSYAAQSITLSTSISLIIVYLIKRKLYHNR